MEPSRQNPADPEIPQPANDTPEQIRKRMLLLSLMLGMMFGVAIYVFVAAIAKQRPIPIAVVLPMFIIAIPIISNLLRLRKTASGQPPTLTDGQRDDRPR